MGSKLTALIDGDTIAFRAAAACEHIITWPTGMVETFARIPEGEAYVDNLLARLQKKVGYDDYKVFLSCPAQDNFRLQIDPGYKSNRANSVRPKLLGHLKGYLRLKYAAQHLAYLEADDCVGIFLTDPDRVPGDKVAVGKDKDFFTVPGKHFQLGDEAIREIDALEASLYHYRQTLSGDAVDGFAGCPGVGKKRAADIVADPIRLIPREKTITRGARKGQKVVGWFEDGPCSVWEAVVCNYEKAGLSEKDAIKTGRLAHILQHGDYDFDTKEITLWVPGRE